MAAHVDPDDGMPPLVHEHTEVTRLRAGHPLAAALPLLRDTLVSIADEARHMMIVTDAQGLILWREGQRDVLRRAVLRSGDAEALWSLADRPDPAPDHGVLEGLRRMLPVDDPRYAIVEALRRGQFRAE